MSTSFYQMNSRPLPRAESKHGMGQFRLHDGFSKPLQGTEETSPLYTQPKFTKPDSQTRIHLQSFVGSDHWELYVSVTASGLSPEQGTAEDTHKDARTYSSGLSGETLALDVTGARSWKLWRLLERRLWASLSWQGVSINKTEEAGRTLSACVL